MARASKLDRSVRSLGELKGRALGLLSEAHRRGAYLDKAHEKLVAFRNAYRPKPPAWVQTQLFAYWQGMVDALHASGLIAWRVRLDGVLIKGSDVPAGRWCDVQVDGGAFVWVASGKPAYSPEDPRGTKHEPAG